MPPAEGHEGPAVVAIVGRPNVGKSSLVNRILGRREAIVDQTPGVTRDRHSFLAEWAGRSFEVVDTGGIETGTESLETLVREQAETAIELADVIVLVVDAASGPMEDDMVIARALRSTTKPVIVAANKADDPRDEAAASIFHRLGLGDPVPLSALHGRGSGDFLETLVRRLPHALESGEGEWASIAIVGRPNVGKSSILNALAGEQRAIVDSVPGTTRDPVDIRLDLADGRSLRVVDTAGMRRDVQVKDPLEYFSLLRSRRTLERVDAALLVIDAGEGVTGHDQRIAEEIVDNGCACVLVLNKWDLLSGQDEAERRWFDRDTDRRLRFLPWATRLTSSALSRRGMGRVLPALDEAIASHRRRVPTARLNAFVRTVQQERPHERSGGRAIRILYAVQAATAPPTIILFTTGRISTNYTRYLEGRLRAAEGFEGTPLRIESRLRTRRQLQS